MSRHNKVNPDHYKTAGRLSPDDLAREQRKQFGASKAGKVRNSANDAVARKISGHRGRKHEVATRTTRED